MGDFEVEFASWMASYGDQLVDMGGPFGSSALALPDGASEGATPSLKTLAGGYMIITADDLDAALEAIRAFPGLVRPGSGTEVIEIRESAG